TEPAEAPVPPSVSIAAKARSGWSRAGVAAVLVLATIGTVLALRPRFAAESIGPVRAVVLPVSINTGDDQDAWAEYGLMSLIATELSRFDALTVYDVQSTISGLGQIGYERDAEPGALFTSVCGALGCTHVVDSTLAVDGNGDTVLDFRLITATDADQLSRVEGGDILQAGTRAADALVTRLVPVRPERPSVASMYTDNRVANQNFALGVSATLQRKFDNAEQYFEIALKEAPSFAWAQLYLSDVYAHTTRFELASNTLDAAERQSVDPQQAIFIAKVRSNIAHEQGSLDASIEFANVMRALAVEHDDALAEGSALMNSAATMQSMGLNREALARYEQALAILDANNFRLRHAQTTFNLGNAHLALGELDTAETYYRDASIAFRSQGADTFLSYVDYALCSVIATKADFDAATPCFTRVRALSESLGDTEGVLLVDTELAGIALAQSDAATAIRHAQQAYDGAAGYAYVRSVASGQLAIAHLNTGDLSIAAAFASERTDNDWFDPRQPVVFVPASLKHAQGDFAGAAASARAIKQRIADQWTQPHQAWLDAFERAESSAQPVLTDYYVLEPDGLVSD
ncbi:MAG: tetratricopeptide repeat protein, partial [Pseudomonadota bacterium]